MERGGLVILLNSVDQDLSRSGDAASDDDDIGIHDAGDMRDRYAQHLAYRVDNGEGERIAGLGVVEDILGSEWIEITKRRIRGRIRRQGEIREADNAGSPSILP